MEIIFQHSTATIRQLPENYRIASFDTKKKSWKWNPDLAANHDLALKVAKALLDFENKYERDGYALVDRINGKITITPQ